MDQHWCDLCEEDGPEHTIIGKHGFEYNICEICLKSTVKYYIKNKVKQKYTQGIYYGGTFKDITDGEEDAVNESLNANCIPTPKGETWDAIMKKWSEVKIEKVDHVQSKVTLPSGWKVVKDPKHRCRCIILDHEGQEIGETSLKNTGYDYRGWTFFDRERLQELGVDI